MTAIEERMFRFFDLPRELRDMIYADLTYDISRRVKQLEVRIRSCPFLSLQLLNHQFREEYEDKVFGFLAVEFSHLVRLEPVDIAHLPPLVLRRAQHATTHLGGTSPQILARNFGSFH